MRKANLIFPSLIAIINAIVWFKTISLNFYNDDFQILTYLLENFTSNPFSVFTSKDVSEYYFRPIPNFILTSTLSIFDFNPLPFRLLSLLLHLALSLTLYFFIIKMHENSKLAFFTSLLFSLLPSHDIYLAWLASIGDVLSAIFILWGFYFLINFRSRKSFLLSVVLFLLSILSKESTLLAPCLAITLTYSFDNQRKRLVRFAILASSFILLLFFYRLFVLDIDIFQSPNIESLSLPISILNFFLYPFVLVIPTFAYSKSNPLSILLNLISLLTFATLLINYIQNEKSKRRNILIYGLAWYFWFVLPAIPLFMRWYSLLPSLGFFIALPELIRTMKSKYITIVSSTLIAILAFINFYSISGWAKANQVATKVLNNARNIQIEKPSGVLLWFLPQYYNNYAILRSGIQQGVNFGRKVKFEDVLIPISIVLSSRSKISLVASDSALFKFIVQNAEIFINRRYESLSAIENDYYRLKAQKLNNDTYEVVVEFLRSKPNYRNFFFDGKSFVSIPWH